MSSSDRSQRKTRPTTISLTADLHLDLRQLAERQLSSVSQIVRQLVRDGVERENRGETYRHGADRDALTAAQQILARVLTAAIVEELLEEAQTLPSEPDSHLQKAPENARFACR